VTQDLNSDSMCVGDAVRSKESMREGGMAAVWGRWPKGVGEAGGQMVERNLRSNCLQPLRVDLQGPRSVVAESKSMIEGFRSVPKTMRSSMDVKSSDLKAPMAALSTLGL
jgi:hypothetical protein